MSITQFAYEKDSQEDAIFKSFIRRFFFFEIEGRVTHFCFKSIGVTSSVTTATS